jgi:hypothetical protein
MMQTIFSSVSSLPPTPATTWNTSRTFALEEIPDAYTYMESNAAVGNLLLLYVVTPLPKCDLGKSTKFSASMCFSSASWKFN